MTSTSRPGRGPITLFALAAATLSIAFASPLWGQSQDQTDDVTPYPPDFLSAPIKNPFLELRAAESTYRARLDLDGFELPLLTLTNPSSEQALGFQVTVTGDAGSRRNLVMELEAGGSSTVSLESARAFGELTIVARGRFEGEVTDARSEIVKPLTAVVDGERSAEKGSQLVCGGNWTLTCIYPPNCTYSTTSPGEVYLVNGEHHVYWGQQYPTGDWTTTNSAGCWVNWKEDPMKPGCPKSARNCYWQLYSVTGTVPQ